MFVSESLNVNEKGHLTIGGVDTTLIAEKYGTPVYVMDENLIRKNCRIYMDSIKKACGGKGMALYASKAFSCMYIYKLAAEEGMGVDVVSGGELYTAYKAGFPMERVYFHGNNKTTDEIELALKTGVGHFVIDNITELERVQAISEKMGKVVNALLRIKPGIDAHTHEYIMTGQIDSKFGFALETGEAMAAVKETLKYKNINLVGIHCHIGSQIFEIEPFMQAAEIMTGFIADIKAEVGIELTKLNLGGGYGIQYVESDDPVGYGEYIGKIAEKVKEVSQNRELDMPEILMEPGRSLVGSSGITLYKVGSVKDIPGIRKYVSVDGGMCDNPRFIMYDAEYTAVVANKADKPKTELVTVAGKCCESGDLLAKDIYIENAESGDILAVLATGAYNYSMSSNYNRIPKPPVVMVKDGECRLVVKRETYDDVLRNDII